MEARNTLYNKSKLIFLMTKDVMLVVMLEIFLCMYVIYNFCLIILINNFL